MSSPYTRQWFMYKLKLKLKLLPCVAIPYSQFDKLKLFEGRSGIYTIYSKTEDKWYVGSAANVFTRVKTHFTNPKRSNKNLQTSILTHGKDDFYILIIVFLGPSALTTATLLFNTEQIYLNLFDFDKLFNIARDASNTKGFKHSESTKALLRLKRLGKTVSEVTKLKLSLLFSNVGNPFYGKKHTTETLLKMSEVKKGIKNPMFGKEKSPEFTYQMFNNKIGDSNPNARSIQFLNVNTNVLLTFSTIKQAELHFNTCRAAFDSCIKNNRLYKLEWKITK